MDRDLTLLLEIQDLEAKVKELRSESALPELERTHFAIDPAEAAEALRTKIGELAGELSTPVGRRYERIAGRVDRIVVPVLAGTCYGCWVQVATATAGEADPNASLQSCEHCGRFLYFPS